MIDITKLITEADHLEPLPQTTVQLAKLVCSPDCNLTDVVELVRFDQALTMQLLRAANTAANASAMRVKTAMEAVTRLGTAKVMALAVAAGVKPQLQRRLPEYGLGESELWEHSVAAAVSAEVLPSFCSMEVPPEVFTAALLHDIGKLVMSRFLTPEILGFIQRAKEAEQLSQMEAETQLLSVHHGELGGMIAQRWTLPETIVQAITYHHNPEAGGSVVCDLTYLSNQIAKQVQAAVRKRVLKLRFDQGALERTGMAESDLEKLRLIAVSRFDLLNRRYNAV